MLAELSAAQQAVPEPSPPSSTTTGQKLGLTLLIDFSDAVGTIAQAEIINFCNGDSYTGYGNNGSVKKYYLDNSNNQLTYSNVVTIYIRVPQPKTYYNNTTNDLRDAGASADHRCHRRHEGADQLHDGHPADVQHPDRGWEQPCGGLQCLLCRGQ